MSASPRAVVGRRPIPTLATAAFAVALVLTVAYWAGAVPGVPKTLPTFTRLVAVTVLSLVVAALAWTLSLGGQ